MNYDFEYLMTLEEVENYNFDKLQYKDCTLLNKSISHGTTVGFTTYGIAFACVVFMLISQLTMVSVSILGYIIQWLPMLIAGFIDRGKYLRWLKVQKKFNSKIRNAVINIVFPDAATGKVNTEKTFWTDKKALPVGNVVSSGDYILTDKFRYEEWKIVRKYKNHKGDVNYKTLFNGFVIYKKIHTNVTGSVRIITSTTELNREVADKFMKLSDSEIRVDVESIEFNRNFEVYAEDKQDAFNIISPYLMEELLKFKNRYKHFQLLVNPNEIIISINDRWLLDSSVSFSDKLVLEDLVLYKVLKSLDRLQEDLTVYLTGGIL